MKKILRQLLMTNLKKIYLKVKAYLMLRIKFQTQFNKFKKEQEKLINRYNKRKTFKDLQLAEIIKTPQKRKVQRDKLAQIAADKIRKKYKKIRFR